MNSIDVELAMVRLMNERVRTMNQDQLTKFKAKCRREAEATIAELGVETARADLLSAIAKRQGEIDLFDVALMEVLAEQP